LRLPICVVCLVAACAAAKTEPDHAHDVPPNETRRPAELAIAADASDSASAEAPRDGHHDDAAAPIETADGSNPTPADTIADEPLQLPGRRLRPKGQVAASSEDETIARWNRGSNADTFHPAPRIQVDIARTRGVREAEVLKVARSKGYWPIRLCFEQGLRKAQRLHGTMSLALVIGQGGAVKGSRKVASVLDDADVARCIVRSFRKLALASPTRKTGTVTLAISLWPGDDPVYVPGSPDPNAGTSPNETAQLAASLRGRWPEVQSCLRKGLARNQGLWGRMALRMHVSPNGEVLDASQVESRFQDPGVTACVLGVYRSASLPAPGKDIIVVYPLRLGSPPEQSNP
jgi:hypothetical protein